MFEINYQYRIFDFTNWATILFFISFVIIAFNKTVYAVKFAEFMRLGFSDKYIKIYKDSGSMRSSFTISMFFLQLISFSFFILLLLSYYNYSSKSDFNTFLQIFIFLIVFVLSKYIIETIIAKIFETDSFVEQFNFLKVSYRTYFAVCLLPINLILYYNNIKILWIYVIISFLLLLINVISYLLSLKFYQNFILSKLFYFILYICTLEIAPYYFIFKWITKN